MFKPFFLVLLLASVLRFTALTFDSLWLDEGYQTVVESYGQPLPDLFNQNGQAFIYSPGKPANINNVLTNFRKVDPLCPPLYAILLNRWLTVFGGSDFALRAFSVLCSLLSISATYFFGCGLLGKRAGLYAALLQAVSPFDIAYAQEARMYSLCTLFATLSGGSLLTLCLKQNLKHKKSYAFAALYVFSTWALINTHYTQLFFWAFAIVAAFFLAIYRKNLFLSIYITIMNAAVVLLSLGWLPLFLQASSVRTASFYVSRQASLLWPFWALFARIPFNWLVFLSGKKVMLWASPLYISSLLLIAYAAWSVIKPAKPSNDSETAAPTKTSVEITIKLLFAWAILPALIVWALDVIESHKVLEISRYLIGTAPAIFLLAGYSLSLLFSKPIFIPLITAHTIFCLANNAYLHLVPQKENWRAVADLIEQTIKPNEPIFISNYYNIVCLDRYLHKPLRQIGVSPSLGTTYLESTLKANISNDMPTFWVLSAQEGNSIFSMIPKQYSVIQKHDFPHALHLRQYHKTAD